LTEWSIRELRRSEHALLEFSFRRLGDESRYQRFLAVKPRLTEADLNRLTDVDDWHHYALVAFSPPPRAPVGVARYVRAAAFDTAEIAIAVVDEWQRRGVGRALALALRDRALRAGIRRFDATMLHGNHGAWALARELGAVETTQPALGGALELAIALAPPGASCRGARAASPPRLKRPRVRARAPRS
jgi:RimJ/RimL family protein N-acetyltransferase